MLPITLYPDKVKRIYENGLTYNNVTIKQVFKNHSELNKKSTTHTLNFLLKNNLAIDIYPFDTPKFYNLFSLNHVPNRHFIDKFNDKIF